MVESVEFNDIVLQYLTFRIFVILKWKVSRLPTLDSSPTGVPTQEHSRDEV